MKVGILSDTHDDEGSALKALELFRREGVEAIFHLGDVTLPRVVAPFSGNGVPFLAVYGNNDVDKEGLQRASGNAFESEPRIVELGGRRILMGHIFDRLHRELVPGAIFDLVLFGHTHRPSTMRTGRTLVVNPGEACGLMSGRRTCAVVDIAAGRAEIFDLDGEGTGAE